MSRFTKVVTSFLGDNNAFSINLRRKCNEAEDFNDVRERTYTRQHYQAMFREKHLRMKAAGALNISVRHVKRLLSGYRQQGLDALISKRRGQPSNNQIPRQLKQLVLKLIRENYQDFGATFAHEKLFECHSHLFSRSFSIETLRKWMIEARLHQPKRCNTLKVYQSRPRQSNSGSREAKSHISKIGSARLRSALFMAARSARVYNPIFRDFTDRL